MLQLFTHNNTRTLELSARRRKNSFSFFFSLGKNIFTSDDELVEPYQNIPLCKKCTLYDVTRVFIETSRYRRIARNSSTYNEKNALSLIYMSL